MYVVIKRVIKQNKIDQKEGKYINREIEEKRGRGMGGKGREWIGYNPIKGMVEKMNFKMKAWKKQPESKTETCLVAQCQEKRVLHEGKNYQPCSTPQRCHIPVKIGIKNNHWIS